MGCINYETTLIYILVEPTVCLNDCLCYHQIYKQANITECIDKNLKHIPKNLDDNTNHFIATGNDFGDIDTVESYFEELEVLNLTSNNIRSLTNNVMKSMMKKTIVMVLDDNNLKYLPKVITTNVNLTVFFISGNPYECNCDMLWMTDWLLGVGNVFDTPYVTCANEEMKGNYLSSCSVVLQII